MRRAAQQRGDSATGPRRDASRLVAWVFSSNPLRRGGHGAVSRPDAKMHLEVVEFPVRRAELGVPAAYEDGVLTIDAGSVRRLVLQDARIAEVRLELTHPSDSARVLRALDAIEPIHKPAGPVTAFSGFLGPPHTVGHGRTHRLA